MKAIEKGFCRVGNSYGIVFDKHIFRESEINITDKVEITYGKNRITIKKKQESK